MSLDSVPTNNSLFCIAPVVNHRAIHVFTALRELVIPASNPLRHSLHRSHKLCRGCAFLLHFRNGNL